MFMSLRCSVADPDPQGSALFCWIRIRTEAHGSGSDLWCNFLSFFTINYKWGQVKKEAGTVNTTCCYVNKKKSYKSEKVWFLMSWEKAGSGSASKWKAGFGSTLKWCRSATLLRCPRPWDVHVSEMFMSLRCPCPWDVHVYEMYMSLRCSCP